MAAYIPGKGDFITVTFDPQSGHEQKGRRPAIVVSNDLFNKHTGLVIVCPITNTDRKFPFHISIDNVPNLKGFIMVEQVKSIDFQSRNAKRIGKASNELITEVLAILDSCIF
ncbi:MAG: type II toxin-antitoxin system PemK/MazF family toxin [Acidobacteria bacterium]|jgi:mRNA interferase MazF|nr:type II toxin-antitoxin system PemK/MazF family toxin [Acidobacteriota bacterium]